jgi:hypothetical protein
MTACRSIRRTAATALALALAAAGVASAEAPINGMWVLDQEPGRKAVNNAAPLTDAARAENQAEARRQAFYGRIKSEAHTKCLPAGMPGMMAPPFGVEVLQTKGRVTIISEVSNLPRTIYLNERAHPADLDPGWNGHSIGHWEGATLVVDTIGFNGRQPRVSTRMHMVERFRLIDGGRYLVDEITLDDPATYTHPFTLSYRYRRLPEENEVMEYICEVVPEDLSAYLAEKPLPAAKAEASPAARRAAAN